MVQTKSPLLCVLHAANSDKNESGSVILKIIPVRFRLHIKSPSGKSRPAVIVCPTSTRTESCGGFCLHEAFLSAHNRTELKCCPFSLPKELHRINADHPSQLPDSDFRSFQSVARYKFHSHHRSNKSHFPPSCASTV